MYGNHKYRVFVGLATLLAIWIFLVGLVYDITFLIGLGAGAFTFLLLVNTFLDRS